MLNVNKITLQLIIAFILFSTSALTFGSDETRDGNWWITQIHLAKVIYITGIYDGMILGLDFATWKYQEPNTTNVEEAGVAQALKSYNEYTKLYLHNVTSLQLSDGLDSFYSDYKNRRIKIEGAIWLVLNGISGMSKDKLETLTESWRKNATN